MAFTEILLLAIRWMHNVAAVAWIGGGIFYLLILRPTLSSTSGPTGPLSNAIGTQFRHLVNTAMAILFVTGVILLVNRLTAYQVSTPYMLVLAIKVMLALCMFYLVWFLRRRTYTSGTKGGRYRQMTTIFGNATTVLVLGVIVLLLSDILTELFQKTLQ